MYNLHDLINSLFELISGLLGILHIKRIIKDKQVQGMSIIPIVFFTIWGYWNLIYYPSVNCLLSFYGGIVIAISNSIWLFLIFYYRSKNDRR